MVIEEPKNQEWENIYDKLRGAYSEGTIRAYRTDIHCYINWCEAVKESPFPANPIVIAAFTANQANTYSAATIKRRLAAIGKVHTLLGFDNPNGQIEAKLALRRALRMKLSRPKQAIGITPIMRNKMIEACNNNLAGKRDKALLAIGFDTLCRRSEVVAIQMEDIEIQNTNSGRVFIRRSKNDPLGMGRIAYISPLSIKLLKIWIKSSGINNGPIFRSIRHNKIQINSLHPNSVNRIIKAAAHKGGIPENTIRGLSGHSMRIGAAQHMMKLGLDILPIMAAGGWKTTNVVSRYIENADRSNLLRKFLKS